jgi:dihydropyrimidine dehydrogenase (NAD+) subunit PreA
VANVTDWNQLDLNYKTLAVIDQDMCIECGLCHIVCEDASHQAISKHKDVNGKRTYTVIDDECVGCNLCALVCPVQDCITMEVQDTGLPYLNWGDHPNNPG